jgi:asparagine synthase (glutamine-hydrolysing)
MKWYLKGVPNDWSSEKGLSMCGLTGFFSPGGFNHVEAAVQLNRMRDTLRHRGPDDAGFWLDADAGIAMAHCRLSIVDLSPAGRQPMVSSSGRYLLVFNGEIYNHMEIRRTLAGIGFRDWKGHSDTETFLAAVEEWGLFKTLKTSVGMFALALWDRKDRMLSLARDRMGEKPIYYGWQKGSLLFGSEIKALRAFSAFKSEIDRNVLQLYLRFGYVPAPWSIYQGVYKLMPGSIVRFGDEAVGEEWGVLQPYWSFTEIAASGQANPFCGSDGEAVNALEQQLSSAVAGQMMADVPLGAFLSGGIDSSTVVALMQRQSRRPVKTFTIGFNEAGYNEGEHARAVARHLGTDHTELYVDDAHARRVIPNLQAMYDEPFGDSSAIPTFLVSQLARKYVTVSLSGDGGDELFGGYGRYLRVGSQWERLENVPYIIRKLAAKAFRLGGQMAFDPLFNRFGAQAGMSLSARMRFWADYMESRSLDALYQANISYWGNLTDTWPRFIGSTANFDRPIEHMMSVDTLTYLPDDILVKVDRAAMAVSLETRVPLLDHRVVELAWQMPYNMKVRNGQGKWLLKQVLYRHVPKEIVDRPKMGFGVPVDEWIRGPLREWAEDLLNEDRLKKEGYLNPKLIRSRWQQHVKGQHNWRDSLWIILMWQAWLETHLKNIDATH